MRRYRCLGVKLAAAMALGALGLGACGGSSDTPAADTSGGSGGGGDQITIKNFAFSPTPLTVKVGTKITVRNDDSATHTLTADDKSLDSGKLDSGSSGSVTVSKGGDIAYHCEIHDYMKGVIRVQG